MKTVLTFPPGNGLRAHQDMMSSYYEELPPEVEFVVEEFGEGCFLIGKGYGELRGEYGSGKLYTPHTLTELIHECKECQQAD